MIPDSSRHPARRLESCFGRPIYAAHEMCHLVCARMLAIPATRRRFRTELETGHADARVFVVTAAPIAAGWAFMGVCVLAAIAAQTGLIALAAILFNVSWQMLCLRDYSCCWYIVRHRRWPQESEGFQGIERLGLRRVKETDRWWLEDPPSMPPTGVPHNDGLVWRVLALIVTQAAR